MMNERNAVGPPIMMMMAPISYHCMQDLYMLDMYVDIRAFVVEQTIRMEISSCRVCVCVVGTSTLVIRIPSMQRIDRCRCVESKNGISNMQAKTTINLDAVGIMPYNARKNFIARKPRF